MNPEDGLAMGKGTPTAVQEEAGAVQEAVEEPAEKAVQGGPPAWLDQAMALLYPASLGLDEGICHLTMKSTLSMLAHCGEAGQCERWSVFFFTAVWVVASLATVSLEPYCVVVMTCGANNGRC